MKKKAAVIKNTITYFWYRASEDNEFKFSILRVWIRSVIKSAKYDSTINANKIFIPRVVNFLL